MNLSDIAYNVEARRQYELEMAIIRSSESYRQEVAMDRGVFAELVKVQEEEEWNGKADWMEIALIFTVLLIIALVLVLIPVVY